jgi:hypothetical protein
LEHLLQQKNNMRTDVSRAFMWGASINRMAGEARRIFRQGQLQMAKAKKSESTTAPAGSKKKTAKEKPAGGEQSPMIDTGLAAESAAKRVAAGMTVATSSTTAGPAHESASFKNLKDSLNKPASAGLAGILDKTAGPGQKKPNLPFQSGKHVGRNQVFGADVNRSGVPRRTGGG